MSHVLVLNASYSPLGTVTWMRSVTLIYEGKAEVIEEYEDKLIRSVSTQMKMPAVIRLFKYIKAKVLGLRFNRENVLMRDRFKCQYCLITVSSKTATFDHVIPKSKNGKTEWNNIVTSCKSCNLKKGDSSPEEAGMKLAAIPIKPSSIPLDVIFASRTQYKFHKSWKQYLVLRELDI